MSLTTTRDQASDDVRTGHDTPPEGPSAENAVRVMNNPQRARSIKDVFARVTMWSAFFLAVMLFTGRVAGPGGRRRAPSVFGGATRNSSMWFCGERSLFGRARNRAARCRDADTG